MKRATSLLIAGILIAMAAPLASATHDAGPLMPPNPNAPSVFDDGVRFSWDAYPEALDAMTIHASSSPTFHLDPEWGSTTLVWSGYATDTSAFVDYLDLPGQSFYARIVAERDGWAAESEPLFVDLGDSPVASFQLYEPSIWDQDVSLSWDYYYESDFDHYEVHADTDDQFTPASSTRIAQIGNPDASYHDFVMDPANHKWAVVTLHISNGDVRYSNYVQLVDSFGDPSNDDDFDDFDSSTEFDDAAYVISGPTGDWACKGLMDKPVIERVYWVEPDLYVDLKPYDDNRAVNFLLFLGDEPKDEVDMRDYLTPGSPLVFDTDETTLKWDLTPDERAEMKKYARDEGKNDVYVRVAAWWLDDPEFDCAVSDEQAISAFGNAGGGADGFSPGVGAVAVIAFAAAAMWTRRRP